MIPLFKVLMSPDTKYRVAEVLESGYVTQGPKVKQFEEELEKVIGERVLTVNSCTSALDLAMHLCGVGPGTEVITTPMTCSATNSPIVTRGARPVWADIDPLTGLINPNGLEEKITSRTKAIVAVDWAGHACDYLALEKISSQYSIPIIRDAAHSFGNPISGGDYKCWSTQAIKHLTSIDGGILKVPGDQYDRAKLLRWYGLDRESSASFRCKQDIQEVGYKYHMNDVAATIGLTNLPLALECLEKNKRNAKLLYENLGSYTDIVWCPDYDPYSSYWFFPILTHPWERDRFMGYCKERGFEASPVHARNDKHSGFNYPNGPLPGVGFFSSRNVGIPCGWWLADNDLDLIIDSVRNFT